MCVSRINEVYKYAILHQGHCHLYIFFKQKKVSWGCICTVDRPTLYTPWAKVSANALTRSNLSMYTLTLQAHRLPIPTSTGWQSCTLCKKCWCGVHSYFHHTNAVTQNASKCKHFKWRHAIYELSLVWTGFRRAIFIRNWENDRFQSCAPVFLNSSA